MKTSGKNAGWYKTKSSYSAKKITSGAAVLKRDQKEFPEVVLK